jgi:hypothetical protein
MINPFEEIESRLSSIENLILDLKHQPTKVEPKNDSEIYLTRKETAEFFKVSLVSIHNYINRGLIRPLKIGNKTMFNKAELINVVESSNRF